MHLKKYIVWMIVILISILSITAYAEEPVQPKNIMKVKLLLGRDSIALDDVWVEYNKDNMDFFLGRDSIYDVQNINCDIKYYFEALGNNQTLYDDYFCAPPLIVGNEHEVELVLPYLDEYDDVVFRDIKGDEALVIPLYDFKKSKTEKTELTITESKIDAVPEESFDQRYENGHSAGQAPVEEQPLLKNDWLFIVGGSLAFVIVLAIFIMMVKGKKQQYQQYYQQ